MEQCSTPGWLNYGEQESKVELKRLLVQTTSELEATIMAARDEITRKEEEIYHMKELLVAAFKERDEAQRQFQKLLADKLSMQQKLQQLATFPGAGLVKGGDANATSFSSSDSEDSAISEHVIARFSTPPLTPSSSLPPLLTAALGKQRALPEKGRLLQAVMEAGPTLQTLLLAGPLPEWRQPPPQLHMIEIPPVKMPSSPVQVVQTARVLLPHQDSMASENGGDLVNYPKINDKNKKRKGPTDSYYGAMSSPRCSNYQRVVQTS
ncbi:hypothetical protein V2J09_019571 [Rumex salicifolius]